MQNCQINNTCQQGVVARDFEGTGCSGAALENGDFYDGTNPFFFRFEDEQGNVAFSILPARELLELISNNEDVEEKSSDCYSSKDFEIYTDLQEIIVESIENGNSRVCNDCQFAVDFLDSLVGAEIGLKAIRYAAVDIHPNEKISITFRNKNKAILNVAFHDQKLVTYAACFEPGEESVKGRFTFNSNETVFNKRLLFILENIVE